MFWSSGIDSIHTLYRPRPGERGRIRAALSSGCVSDVFFWSSSSSERPEAVRYALMVLS